VDVMPSWEFMNTAPVVAAPSAPVGNGGGGGQ